LVAPELLPEVVDYAQELLCLGKIYVDHGKRSIDRKVDLLQLFWLDYLHNIIPFNIAYVETIHDLL